MRSLKSVSNTELIKSLKQLVQKEQDLTLHILRLINEVEARGLYLELAYSTITEYCIHELGYGDSSAGRRVRVARLIRKVPEVYDLLIKKKLSFSAAVQVASVLSPDNKDDLLPQLIGKSRSQIERLLAGYQIPRRIADQARPTMVKKLVRVERAPAGILPGGPGEAHPAANMEVDVESLRETRPEELGEMPRHCDGANAPMPGAALVEVKEVVERMFEIRFAGDDELMELINFMRSHLSHRFPKGAGFLDIFKYAMRYVKDREDLALQKESTRKAASRTDSRHIPAKTKQQVWKRDKGRCTYVGVNHKRCNSDYLIQFDHYPIPHARGGRSTADNLRLLCAKHNRHAAEKTYGEAAIKRHYIKEAGAGYAPVRVPGGSAIEKLRLKEAGAGYAPVRAPGSSPFANRTPDRTSRLAGYN
jgi:hypothetical protein